MSKKEYKKCHARCWEEFYTHILLLAYIEPDKKYTIAQIAEMMSVTLDLNRAEIPPQKPF